LKVENEQHDVFRLNTEHNYAYKLIYTEG